MEQFFQLVLLVYVSLTFAAVKPEPETELETDLGLDLFQGQPIVHIPLPSGYKRWGDMILPEDFFSNSSIVKNAVPLRSQLWPNRRITYYVDPSLSHIQSGISRAIQEYHAKTCVRFIPYVEGDQNYVHLFSGDGCYSLVGFTNMGGQPLSLGTGCTDHGTIVHELGHAVGFYHEHCRSDRDGHLDILWENIMEGTQDQFTKLQPHENKLFKGLGFDVSSIMLYGELSFSKDGYSPTMQHKGGQRLLEVYQKPGLSYSDARRINSLYGC